MIMTPGMSQFLQAAPKDQEMALPNNDDTLSIGTAFNLQRKFERLHISREDLMYKSTIKSEIPAFSGLGKRTFRELERWDIEDENASPTSLSKMNRSVADYNDEQF